MNDFEKITNRLTVLQSKYNGYPWLQRHELVELKDEFNKIMETIRDLQEEVAGEIDHKRVGY